MGFERLARAIVAVLVLAHGILPSATTLTATELSQRLPASVPLSEVEIRLEHRVGGGCVGRCIHYRITIRGDGAVIYEDLADPPVARRQRIISVDDVVALVNEFVRARFFEASDRYVGSSFYALEGEQLLLHGRGGADGSEWDLRFRLGNATKSVYLYRDYPEALRRVRDLVEQIGGPSVWTK